MPKVGNFLQLDFALLAHNFDKIQLVRVMYLGFRCFLTIVYVAVFKMQTITQTLLCPVAARVNCFYNYSVTV